MNPLFIQYFSSPFGELVVGEYQQQLCLCDWRYRKMRTAIDQRILTGMQATFVEAATPLLTETIRQLNAYFSQSSQTFDLPILLVGTDFQKLVWQTLQKIPYGKTESYRTLAQMLHNEKAIRAVATANGANALAIIIPCHRIIGSNGKMVGYAGGLPTKQKLLQLESPKKQYVLF